MSLAHPKVRILQKKPPTPQIEDMHMFQLNPQFSISEIAPKSIAQNLVFQVPVFNICTRLKNNLEMDGFRLWKRNQLDTIVFRIVKQHHRVVISHANLVHEALDQMSQLRIPACYTSYPDAINNTNNPKLAMRMTPIDVRQIIDDLIDANYVKRESANSQNYLYVA
jgi:hypothetical protein